MSDTVACETLDAMCCVCGAHCATWVGEDEHGKRHYTLDACHNWGQRLVMHHVDALETDRKLERLSAA
ncbi:MAG: hypothetical protein ACE1ZA_18065 [Pseudomonadales bacterium]